MMRRTRIPAPRPAALAAAAALLVAALALPACVIAPRVTSDYDREARFSTFHSFSVIVRPHPGSGDPLVEQRTYDAIRAELTSKGFGYVMDPGQADFAVDFTIGAADRLDVRSFPSPSGAPWSRAGWAGNHLDVYRYQEGTLAIDVFDARSHRPIWHGSARKELSQSDIASSQRVIQEAVAAVLASFPPKGT